MRKLIAGMKISVDGKMEGPEGYADWVEAWSEDYGLMSQVDACLVGGGMYPHYEQEPKQKERNCALRARISSGKSTANSTTSKKFGAFILSFLNIG